MLWSRSKSLKDIKYRDEISRLQSMASKLTSTTNELDVTTDDLQEAAVEVAEISIKNSTQIANTAAQIEEIQEALCELGNMIGGE